MRYTTLGRSGLRVSRLGFGAMRLPMKEGHVDRDLSIALMRRAVDLGINYFDSAVGYCNSESEITLGEAMEGIRDRVILSTKNIFYNKTDEAGWWRNIENSLKRLRTGCIDVYNFHSLSWKNFVEHVAGPDGQMKWMLRARDQGMIRHICFSCHDSHENLAKLAATGLFEAVTLQYNLLDRTHEPVLRDVAEKHGLGIIVMGPVGGGRLGGDSDEIRRLMPNARSVPEIALRFVLANPYVSLALSGMNTYKQIAENVAVASRRTAFTPTEKRRTTLVLNRFKKLAKLYCTGCNYCMPCPAGVNISSNFSALNYARVYGLRQHARSSYTRLAGSQAAHCIECRRCVPKCPQKIDIPGQLREAVRTLDDAYGSLVSRVMPVRLATFGASKGQWRAAFDLRFDLHNISDEAVQARATFDPPAGKPRQVTPESASIHMDSFAWRSVKLRASCASDGRGDLVDLGARIESPLKRIVIGNTFRAAFAARAGTSVPTSIRSAVPLRIATSSAPRSRSGTCRFAYDGKNLYFFAEARRADQIMLLLDTRPLPRRCRASWDREVFLISMNAPNDRNVPIVQVIRPRRTEPGLVNAKSERTADGFRVQAAINWKLLGLTKASCRSALGMDVTLSAHRTPARPVSWSGGKAHARPESCGYLFLTQTKGARK